MPVQRLILRDLINSDLPGLIGHCPSDTAAIANAVNRAQSRLLTCREAGEEGWYGGYAEMAFNVSRNAPYLRLPRGVARLISVDACTVPIPIRNQFYEYLEFGDGHWPKTGCASTSSVCAFGKTQSLRRNTSATWFDLEPPRKGLRIYPSESADVGSNRMLFGGNDANDQRIQTLDGAVQVRGVYTALDHPYADVVLPLTTAPIEISYLDTILKDTTIGPVSVYEVDLDTGTERLLVTMEPGETSAAYASYYLNELPQGCCPAPGQSDDSLVQLTAMVKLDLIPARCDSDPLLIQSAEAIIAECQSGHLARQEFSEAKSQALERHIAAVRLLRGEQRHYEGDQQTAVAFAPFGSARLWTQNIGGMR